MAVEIEAKMRVASHDAIRAKLLSVNAQETGEFFETNIFFDTDDRSLLAADQGLRLRINHSVTENVSQFVLTFKGPRLHGKLKSREENELHVTSADDAEKFLASLGFTKVLSFEKKRQKWKLEGCTIELDLLPYLGTFVEIEGPSEAKIMKVRETLGLGDLPIIKTSYIAMLMAWLQEHNSSDKFVRFETH